MIKEQSRQKILETLDNLVETICTSYKSDWYKYDRIFVEQHLGANKFSNKLLVIIRQSGTFAMIITDKDKEIKLNHYAYTLFDDNGIKEETAKNRLITCSQEKQTLFFVIKKLNEDYLLYPADEFAVHKLSDDL